MAVSRTTLIAATAVLTLGLAAAAFFVAEQSARSMARAAFAAETFASECQLTIDRRKLATYERRKGYEFSEVISHMRNGTLNNACRMARELAEKAGVLGEAKSAQDLRPVSQEAAIPRP